MKDSSWLIIISISLLKKILKNNIVSLVDITYPKGLVKFCYKKAFLCKTSCRTTSSFSSTVPHRYIIPSFQYLTGILPFSNPPFWKLWHNTSYMAIQPSISEDAAIPNSFTLQRCTQSTRSRKSVGNHPRTVINCMRTLDNWSQLFTMFKLVYGYPVNWVCAPRQRVTHNHDRRPNYCNWSEINPTLGMSRSTPSWWHFSSEDPSS